MKIDRKIIRKLHINVPGMLLVLVVLGGFLWLNQKPDFSEYHSYAVVGMYFKDYNGGKVPLTEEQFQRITEVYKNDETLYYEWFEPFWDGYEIHLYKTTDMSGQFDIMYTGGLEDKYLMIGKLQKNGHWSWKGWGYYPTKEHNAFRQTEAIIEEAINEAEGK